MRVEREVVKLHSKIGVPAERVPLSGAQRYQGNGEDVDIYPFGYDEAPVIAQVKCNQKGVKGLMEALGDADCLFLRWDAEPGQPARAPHVLLTWEAYERLLLRAK
jgi:hypothetical protein